MKDSRWYFGWLVFLLSLLFAAHICAADDFIDIEKLTNGEDADVAPGPTLFVGDTVNWTYEITNISEVPVSNITVTDDQGVTVTCPSTSLAAGGSMICTASGIVQEGQYANVGLVEAFLGDIPVSDIDPSHYFGQAEAPNEPPDCSTARPSICKIWPPNHKKVRVKVLGVYDPDGDEVTITITGIFQDEPVDERGDGRFAPDAGGVGCSKAWVRAERSGLGSGRVYHIFFTANDGNGAFCEDGHVEVVVPKSKGKRWWCNTVDEGMLYDSTASCDDWKCKDKDK